MKQPKTQESWKPIPDYEALYLASSLGRVMRIGKAMGTNPGKILRPGYNKKGYQMYVLSKNGKCTTRKAHHLILESFIGLRPDGYEVNHKNGIRDDNRLDNIEYVTQEYNIRHQYTVLQNSGKLCASDIRAIRYKHKNFKMSYTQLATEYDIDYSVIGKIIRRAIWKWVE